MQRKIWLGLITLLMIGVISSITFAEKGEEKEKDIVAVVEGEEITKDVLVQRLIKQFGKRILDQMADEILIAQAAKKEKVKVSKKELEKKLEETKKRFPNAEAFESMLERSGSTLDDIRNQLRFQTLVEKIVAKKVKVTDKDLKDHFEKNKKRLGEPEKVKLSHILVKTKEEAKQIKKELDEGAKFSQLAKEKSIDEGTKKKRGDLGFLEARQCRARFGPAFQKAAFALKKGGTSKPVKSRNGYHLILAGEKKEAREAEFKKVKGQIEETLQRQKMMEEMRKWYDDLKEKAEIEIRL